MWLWKKFNNLNTTSKVIILILVILLIVGITSIIFINYKKVEDIPLQNDSILSSSLNIEENINEVVNQETINNEIKEEKDIQENNSNAENKQVIQSNNTNNTLVNTSKNNNVSNQTNNKQENNKQENTKQENNKTEINKETNNQTNTQIKNEQPTGNAELANTHFKKYNKEKTNHAVAYLNSKIKQLEDYETFGGKAIAVTEKPCKDWFSYSYDEKLNSLVITGCTLKVYIEDEYTYDSKGINYYLYDTKAYIYTY